MCSASDLFQVGFSSGSGGAYIRGEGKHIFGWTFVFQKSLGQDLDRMRTVIEFFDAHIVKL